MSNLAVMRDAAIKPHGDIIVADVAREAANEIVDRLDDLGVPQAGTVHIEPVDTWMSQAGLDSELRTPGSSADAVVWADVTQRAYQGVRTQLDLSVLHDAGHPASRHRHHRGLPDPRHRCHGPRSRVRSRRCPRSRARPPPTRRCSSGRSNALTRFRRRYRASPPSPRSPDDPLGWITVDDVTGARPGTDFIYTPDKWSFIVALIAAAAGVLSLTSAQVGGLSGVFISVTTVPAAGNVALGIAFGATGEIWASTIQLLLNITGMAIAGWATLAFQQSVWSRKAKRRRRDLSHRRT
ncbi:MAG: DUF389 domain-containing protein [Nocardioidaceae bacterium]